MTTRERTITTIAILCLFAWACWLTVNVQRQAAQIDQLETALKDATGKTQILGTR